MNKLLTASILFALSTPTWAQCIGTGSLKTCYDANGSSYTVNRLGNTTMVNGINSNGSTWSQTSTTYGSTTYHNGTAANGNTWNSTQRQLGNGMQSWSGLDSNGNSFNCLSTRYGSDC